jgi:hypothetical protein
MEGGRRGGTLRCLVAGLGKPQAEYGICPGTEPEADPGRVCPELEYRRIDAVDGAGECGNAEGNAKYSGGRLRTPNGVRRSWGIVMRGWMWGTRGRQGPKK